MIVLDTHVWIRWINLDAQISPRWRARIESDEDVGVSAISCFETAWLAGHGRIVLPCPIANWLELALGGSGVALLPLSPDVARVAVALPEHHRDPQDRLIIATALVHDATLISADSKFPLYTELSGRLLT